MAAIHSRTSNYDDYSAEYAAYAAQREQGGVEDDPLGILPCLLQFLGDVARRSVLDAGCGEGYLDSSFISPRSRMVGHFSSFSSVNGKEKGRPRGRSTPL